MKDSLFPIAVLVLLVGGAWFVVNRYLGSRSVEGASIPPAVTAPPETKKGTPAKSSKHVRPAHSAVRNDNRVEQTANLPQSDPIVVDVPLAGATQVAQRPFPSPADLTPGTERVRIRDRFGRPDIQATTVDRGALRETYLYHRRSDGQTVVVYLTNGRVEHAQAMPY